MAESIFTRIIKGEIPSHKVYEDDHVFAFLDIAPLSPGHTLVVPKEEAQTIHGLSDDSASALGRALPRLSRALREATGADDLNILQNNGKAAGQLVDHVHIHLIPMHADGRGLGVKWRPSDIDHEAGAALALDIASRLATGGSA